MRSISKLDMVFVIIFIIKKYCNWCFSCQIICYLGYYYVCFYLFFVYFCVEWCGDGVIFEYCNSGVCDGGDGYENILQWCYDIIYYFVQDLFMVYFDDFQRYSNDVKGEISSVDICYEKIVWCLSFLQVYYYC